MIFVMRCQDPLKCAASQNSSVTHCGKISIIVHVLFDNFLKMVKFGKKNPRSAVPRLLAFNNIDRKIFGIFVTDLVVLKI